MHQTGLAYRPEVDGLRALAVLPVILFHAGFGFAPGGFIGVDVFFVISGFLITRILIEDLDAGRFSILDFYERRARRILPALTLVLLASLPLGVLFMLPYELRDLGESMVAVTFFVSNIYFAENVSYFGGVAEEMPLLHTWSLAVEEQFYIAFPLLLWLMRNRRRWIVPVLAVIALISLGVADAHVNRVPDRVFYLIWFRAWELLAGSLAAIYVMRRGQPGGVMAETLGLLGLAGIVVPMAAYGDWVPFPSFWAVPPVLGTALVLVAATPQRIAGRLLSWRPFVAVGLISYSAYLWHQPLFAYARLATEGAPTPILMGTLALLTLGLSWLSWRFVEQPFRNRSRYTRTVVFGASLGAGLAVLSLAGLLVATGGLLNRYPEPQRGWVAQTNLEHGTYVAAAYEAARNRPLDGDRPNVVVVGDSFSEDVFNMILESGAFAGYALSTLQVPARCQIVYGLPKDEILQWVDPGDRGLCARRLLRDKDVARLRQADIVILAASWRHWSAEHLAATIAALQLPTETKLLVIGSKSFEPSRRALLRVPDPAIARVAPTERAAETTAILTRTLPEGIFVNTLAQVCPGGCPLFTPEGAMISHDGHHLTQEGARHLGNILFRAPPLNRASGLPLIEAGLGD